MEKRFNSHFPSNKFPRGLGAEKIEGKDEQLNAFPTMPHYLIAGSYNYVSEINPQTGDEDVEVKLVLQASKPVQLQIVADEGVDLPVDDFQVYGLNERYGWQPDKTTEFVVEDLLPNEIRKVFAYHRGAEIRDLDESSEPKRKSNSDPGR